MGRLARLGVGLVVLAAVVAGVVVGFDRPTVDSAESHVVDVNATTTLVRTDLVITNPNPVGVRLGDATVTHSVSMNGVTMGNGTKEGLRITRRTTNVSLTTAIDNRKVPAWWVRHIENGERTRVETSASLAVPVLGRTARVTDTATVRTDITGRLNSSTPRPVNANLPLVADPVLVVNRTRATWGAVTNETTPLDVHARLYNPRAVPIDVSRLEYTVTMNGITVGNGTAGANTTIPAAGHRTLRAAAVVRTNRLDEWWVTHVRRDQHTDLRVGFTAVLSLPNGGTVRVPLDGLDYTATVDTDLLTNRGSAGEPLAATSQFPSHDGKHGLGVSSKATA